MAADVDDVVQLAVALGYALGAPLPSLEDSSGGYLA
jgi:hypothetical protein